MNERDDDRADLNASRAALAAARTGAVETDAAIADLRATSDRIQSVVEPNGYVLRFRELLRGA